MTNSYFSFKLMRGETPREDIKTTISGPSSARQQNGVLLTDGCWPNIEYWLGSFVIFQG